jgi:hypothetical protein
MPVNIINAAKAAKEKTMKRFFVLGTAVVAVFLLSGCGSAPSAAGGSGGGGQSGIPAFVNEAKSNASEDMLVGIGMYRIGNDMSRYNRGLQMAEMRARTAIAQQLSTIVKNMITDFSEGSEVDPDAALAYERNITVALSKAELNGAVLKKTELIDGVVIAAVEYSKSAAAASVNQAANAAKLSIPAAAALNAIDYMDAAFSKEAGGGPETIGD